MRTLDNSELGHWERRKDENNTKMKNLCVSSTSNIRDGTITVMRDQSLWIREKVNTHTQKANS